MRAIDTNVLVRLITRDTESQTEAAEHFIKEGAWVPVLALVEATWVLDSVYELGPEAIATAIELLLDHKELVLEDSETIGDALKIFRAKPALGFSACLMLSMARRTRNLPLGTFDSGLAKVAGAQEL
jgi:predicted nucleic-acid-binding protein